MQNELMGKANEILGLLAEDKNVLLTGAPVSYTHLDVYKRQR